MKYFCFRSITKNMAGQYFTCLTNYLPLLGSSSFHLKHGQEYTIQLMSSTWFVNDPIPSMGQFFSQINMISRHFSSTRCYGLQSGKKTSRNSWEIGDLVKHGVKHCFTLINGLLIVHSHATWRFWRRGNVFIFSCHSLFIPQLWTLHC